MVNWSDLEEQARIAEAFERMMFVILGIIVWENFRTIGFEWSLITGKRRFRWPLIFFFLCRYCILLAIIGLVVSFSVTKPINCRALFIFNSWAGNTTILCASTSLMLRTIALWERRKLITIPLCILCSGHWVLLWRTMFIVRADWEPTQNTCVVTQADPTLLNVQYFFTMSFDFIILVFTSIALIMKHTVRTDLWRLLFTDGLSYFLITFSANSIPAVLNVLNLNTPMNVIATVPAASISSIAACRAVMRLLDFTNKDNVHFVSTIPGIRGSDRLPSNVRAPSPLPSPKFAKFAPPRPSSEVHVTTEQFTRTESEIFTEPDLRPSQRRNGSISSNSDDLESGKV